MFKSLQRKSVPPRIVYDDVTGLPRIVSAEQEYREGYEQACKLIRDDNYMKQLLARLRGEFFNISYNNSLEK